MATARNNAARKPAANNGAAPAANLPAVVPGAPAASNLPANVAAPTGAAPCTPPAAGWPAANNGAAWLALLVASVPALTAARAHKYGAGAGLLPCANASFTATAWGVTAGNAGGKSPTGRYTVMALMCLAHKLAVQATQNPAPCGAAIAYFAYTAPVLALLQPPHTKTAKYVGRAAAGAFNVPCAAWLSGYVQGACRTPHLLLAKAS